MASRILVYDGDCALCERASRLAERRWLVGEADTDMVPAPVSALVGVQLAAVLATVRRRRG